MKNKKLFLRCASGLLAVMLLAGGLVGCAAGKASATDAAAPGAMTPSQNSSYLFEDGGAWYDGYYESADASPAEGGFGGGLSVPADGRKVILSADVTLESKSYDEALGLLLARLTEAGGYLAGREDYDYYARESYLQLRVPSGQFAAFIEGLNDVANVIRCSQYQEDVTDSYIETESYLASLQTQQQRLLELMEEAASLEELLQIEDRLADVRARLQYFDSLKNSYDSRIAYASIDVSLREVRDYTVTQPTFGQRLQNALTASGRGFVDFLQGLLFFLIAAAPYLVILALVLWLVLRLTKKRRAARRAARAAKKRGAGADAAPAEAGEPAQDAPQP